MSLRDVGERYVRCMSGVWPFLVVVGGFAVIMGSFTWFAFWVRRRGVGGALMGPIDEIYNPAAHRYRIEIEIQAQRMVPTPSADDEWR